jgi:hypothetical protein
LLIRESQKFRTFRIAVRSGPGLAQWREQDSTPCVAPRFDPSLIDYELADLLAMQPEEVVALAWRQREALRSLANRLGEDSTTSSRPPSSDDPYRREARGKPASAGPSGGGDAQTSSAPPGKAGAPAEKKPGRPAGKQPGGRGFWRSQPIVTSAEVAHAPIVCAACGAALGPDLTRRCVGAHNSLKLARGEMSLQLTATKHVYFAVRCILRSGQRGTSPRRIALGYRGPQAEPAHERALPGRPDARNLHRGAVAPLPHVAR